MDLAREEEGAQIVSCTSYDPKCPVNNIIGSDDNKIWVSTGSFPQEITLQLASISLISKIKTWTRNVQRLQVEICPTLSLSKFEKLFEIDVTENEGNLQIEAQSSFNRQEAYYIKFKILSGWNDFIIFHKISVEGKKK